MSEDLLALRELADAAAMAGARAAMAHFRQADLAVERKADESPVTVADRESEAAIRAVIAAARPEDGWLGEETGTSAGTSGRRWIVDPIDGTKNFLRGIPQWAVLVACEERGEIIASAVHIPGQGERYDAVRGGGARCNDEAIRVSARSTLADALWCFETPALFRDHGLGPLFDELVASTGLQRGLADAYGHMLIASGRAELMIEPSLSIWDMAAPSLVVSEAGGRFTDLAGVPGHHGTGAVVGNAAVHAAALDLIAAQRRGGAPSAS